MSVGDSLMRAARAEILGAEMSLHPFAIKKVVLRRMIREDGRRSAIGARWW